MPVQSKYSAQQQEELFENLLNTLTEERVPRDLALMTLGNLVTHVIQQENSAQRKAQLAEQFGAILKQSVSQN
ncbi:MULTISPECIES: DUF1414 domain-containing protein [Gammaproteobacteria]|uniref:DUF1414 domain-containing protein n=1 Tax=Gammaproteobacteria TaxID=1236 RepID=UPI000DD06CA0|nr:MULTISPECIES: DUF1414 domain-containing protein [Gammaproteobacteria]RTE87168.1 DUF1414 domain-containing protein [Aliidiomarina sp. B3213]TCZ93044.1 DUF1414 domain-containing protein [Lysobacter sp. N42]